MKRPTLNNIIRTERIKWLSAEERMLLQEIKDVKQYSTANKN